MSSVTYITGSPSFTANSIDSCVRFSSRSIDQSSVYCLMADEPMNRQVSTGTPEDDAILAIGSMSRTMVRAAQFGRIDSLSSAICRQSAVESATALGPAPGRPTSAVSTPRAFIALRIVIFIWIGGSVTLGPCSPSRSVSSSRAMEAGGFGMEPTWFQS